MEVIAESHQHFLTSLAFDTCTGTLYALCAASGEIVRIDPTQTAFVEVAKTNVRASSFAFVPDTSEGAEPHWVLACPDSRQLLTTSAVPAGAEFSEDGNIEPAGLPLTPFPSTPHAAPLLGPNAVAVSPVDGEVFFTDAGALGAASLLHPIGGVLCTVQRHRAVVALQPTGLAQPSALTVGYDGCVFVCEMARNRLLRYVPRGNGGSRPPYIGSVFARFHGSLGPSAVAVHPRSGHLFVALYEGEEVGRAYAAVEDETNVTVSALPGRVVRLDQTGAEVCTYTLPDPQLRAIAMDGDGGCLYVVASDSTSCCSTLYRIPIEG